MQKNPPKLPHITPAMARHARDHFQPLYADPLTEEDGREIAVNVLGAFAVLMEWKQKRDARVAAGLPAFEALPTPSRSHRPKCERKPE